MTKEEGGKRLLFPLVAAFAVSIFLYCACPGGVIIWTDFFMNRGYLPESARVIAIP